MMVSRGRSVHSVGQESRLRVDLTRSSRRHGITLLRLAGRPESTRRGHASRAIECRGSTSSVLRDGLGDFRRKAFLIGLGLGGLLHRLDLLFHWLEGGSEHGGG